MRKNFSKEIFPIKRNSDGSIQRYKAKLVVKGFHQCLGLDYTETFNTLVKLTTNKQFYVLIRPHCMSCHLILAQTGVINKIYNI